MSGADVAAKTLPHLPALKRFIQNEAAALGFDLCRITGPDTIDVAGQGLRHFLDNGYHGTMAWMEETADRRASPSALWPDVRSVIMLGFNYGPETDPLANLSKPEKANISVYARNRDYHDVIKGKLKELAGKIAVRAKADVKVFVDTAPVMEKPLAAAAGLGWQGKHTNLVSRTKGSWLFLGSIFTTALLEPDAPEVDHCGSCQACLSACPTNAFPAPYQLDARKCISYLTIEHKGSIDPALRRAFGNRIYGCDDCLAACPWNKFAEASREMKLAARPDLQSPDLASFLVLDDAAFRALFSGSPVKRIGRDRFIRNCLIAAGNSGLAELAPLCEALCADTSPVVRAMAVWACRQLLDPEKFSARIGAMAEEQDPQVLDEMRSAGDVTCI